MKLDEILNKPLPFEVTSNNDAEFQAEFQAGDRMIRFSAFNEFDSDWDEENEDMEDDHEWSVEFSEIDGHNSSHGKTGSGNEFQVFATIKAILEKFAKERDPWYIRFEADKNDGNRARLYSRMIKKNLPDGWKVQIDDVGRLYQQFTLIPESLTEALDKPLPYTIKANNSRFFEATFHAGWRRIEFMAMYTSASIWEVSFSEVQGDNETTKKTGSGNEFEVFATVKAIINEFIEKRNPTNIVFDSFKGEANRAKLYQRMLNKNLPAGYKMKRDDDHPSYTSFVLSKA